MWIFVNGNFVRQEEAVVSVFDHGFLYGDGVYETIRSYGARIFMRDHHIARLYRSAKAIGLTIPVPSNEWPDLLHEAMRRNDVGHSRQDAYLRITISRGPGDIGLDPSLCPNPTIVIITKPLVPPAPHVYEQGVSLIVAKTRRNLPSALSPHIKATNFLNNILAKREAITAGAFDSLLLNWENYVTECTVSNLFFVRNGRVQTPAVECGILDGITREVVLRLAKDQSFPVDEGRFTVDHLREADECFLTNTSMEIMPVVSIDGRPIGSGKPGPITRSLQTSFRERREHFLEPVS